MKKIIILLTITSFLQLNAQNNMKQIEKNRMHVAWKITADHIHFEMEAPTQGWVTIGFNESSVITGAYLLMGRVKDGKAEVVEHYTSSPGNYQPITNYGVPSNVSHVKGIQTNSSTKLVFSITAVPASKYHKTLTENSSWNLIMAYSREDDFQHHSMMRTSEKIKL